MTLTLSAFESAQRNLEQQLLEHLREMDPLRSRFHALHGELVELRTAGLRADEYNFAQIQQLSKEFEAFAGASFAHRTAARDAVRCEAALGALYEGAWLRPAMCSQPMQHTLGTSKHRCWPSSVIGCDSARVFWFGGADSKGMSLEQLARGLASVEEQCAEGRRVADAIQRRLEAYMADMAGIGAGFASAPEFDSLKVAFVDLVGKFRDSETLAHQHMARLTDVMGFAERVAKQIEAAKHEAQQGDAAIVQRLELLAKLGEKDRMEVARVQSDLAQVGLRALSVCEWHGRIRCLVSVYCRHRC